MLICQSSSIVHTPYTVHRTRTRHKNISQNEHEHRQIKPEQRNIATKRGKRKGKSKKEKATKPYTLYTEQGKRTKARKGGESPSAVVVNVISSSCWSKPAREWNNGWMDELMPRREVTCNAASGQIMRSQHAQGSCLSFLSFQIFLITPNWARGIIRKNRRQEHQKRKGIGEEKKKEEIKKKEGGRKEKEEKDFYMTSASIIYLQTADQNTSTRP